MMSRYSLVLWALLSLPMVAQAHLLNMTRVQVAIDEQGQALIELDIDLTKALDGGNAYYALARQSQAQQSPAFAQLLEQLTEASQFTMGSEPLNWQLKKVTWPDAPAEDFTSGLAWPMTRFAFSLQLPAGFTDESLRVVFTDAFKFEEPIAVNIRYADERITLSRWLVRNQVSPAFSFIPQPQPGLINTADMQLWFSYFKQGMLHIVPYGWDHALFVLGLFLGVTSMRQLALLITGFTLAHTVTLGLATYGAIVVSGHIIEPIIALSIAWIAVENLLYKPRLGWRFILVFMFGLVHGLGFAQALKAFGIPTSGFAGALVSFNIGVEIAQLSIVVLAFIVMKSLSRYTRFSALLAKAGSVCIALLASFWFVQRVLS